jgi:hypothetical protein
MLVCDDNSVNPPDAILLPVRGGKLVWDHIYIALLVVVVVCGHIYTDYRTTPVVSSLLMLCFVFLFFFGSASQNSKHADAHM